MQKKKDYRPMWKELDLDLEAHDGLLQALGDGYAESYLHQKKRPKSMEYFDFVVSEAHGLRIEELQEERSKGNKIIGTFCVYVPDEIILALDAVGVGLCAGAEIGFEEAERYLPRNLCSLIKSFMGFELASLCPYMRSCDLVVGETTCDGKKKAYEILTDFKDSYVMELPQTKEDGSREAWRNEVYKFAKRAEALVGKSLTPERLREAIRVVNDRRRAQLRLRDLRKANPAPISGRDALLINMIAFYDNPQRFTESLNKVCDELEERIERSEGIAPAEAPRIVLSGCPMALPNWKVPFIIESAGAVIVAEESCVGERGFRNLVDESGETVDDMIENLVDRYLKIDCACFTPNPDRIKHVLEDIDEFEGDGVIHYTLQFCTPYLVESYLVERAVKDRGLPVLAIDTDYSPGDAGQIQTRVEAFLETLERSPAAK